MGQAALRGSATVRKSRRTPSRRHATWPGLPVAIDAWRIDSWSVRDGAAFASRREAESMDADSTVFIAVPDLEAVPVGRMSTALSATRRHFQEGLRNDS